VALSLLLILPLLVFFATGASPLLFGNLFSQFGLFGEDIVLLGRRPVILGPNFNRLACILGMIGLALTVPRLLSLRFSSPRFHGSITPRSAAEADLTHVQPDRFGFVPLLAGLVLLCIFVFRGVYFDRYLLPVLVSFPLMNVRLLFVPQSGTEYHRVSAMRRIRSVLGAMQNTEGSRNWLT